MEAIRVSGLASVPLPERIAMNKLPTQSIRPKRCWLSFSLRAMLILLTLACLFLDSVGTFTFDHKLCHCASREIS